MNAKLLLLSVGFVSMIGLALLALAHSTTKQIAREAEQSKALANARDASERRAVELSRALANVHETLTATRADASALAGKVEALSRRIADLELALRNATPAPPAPVPPVTGPAVGLTAWWKLDETDGAIARDSSGMGHNVRIVGDPVRRPGRFGGALELDGIDDGLVLAERAPDGFMHDPFDEKTVSLWVRQDAPAVEGVLYDEGGATSGLALRLDSDRLRAACRSLDEMAQLSARRGFGLGEWRQITLVFDRGRLTVYVDGAPCGSVTAVFSEVARHNDDAGVGVCGRSDALGHMNIGGLHFKGLVDEIQLYNRALSPEEVRSLSTGKPAPMVPKRPPALAPPVQAEKADIF